VVGVRERGSERLVGGRRCGGEGVRADRRVERSGVDHGGSGQSAGEPMNERVSELVLHGNRFQD
jgi:hypothetical protein